MKYYLVKCSPIRGKFDSHFAVAIQVGDSIVNYKEANHKVTEITEKEFYEEPLFYRLYAKKG